MEQPRPPRWKRRAARRREGTRRMLAAGALAGLVGGVAAQVWIGQTLHGDVADLARVIFVLPAGIFVAWWLLVPGVSLERGAAAPREHALDGGIQTRIEQIEAAFGAAAMPAVRRQSAQPVDTAMRAAFKRSIRRASASTPDAIVSYGVRRPPSEGPATTPEPARVEAAEDDAVSGGL